MSWRSNSRGNQLTQHEKLQSQCDELVKQRNQAIAELNQKIEDAEREIAKYRSLTAMKYKELEELRQKEAKENESEEDSDEKTEDNEVQDLLEANSKELEESEQSFKEEIEELKREYKEKIEEAERWALEHVEVAAQEKEIELRELEQELELVRSDNETIKMKQSKTLTTAQEQIDKVSEQNENRVRYLQGEISKLTASTREEVRDVRNKINETLSTIEITEIEHQNVIQKYEKEIVEREKIYDDCLKSLNEQFEAEKKHIEKSMEIAVAQAQSAVSVKKRLEKFHEKQIQTSMMDTERLKTTLTQSKSKDTDSLQLTSTLAAKLQEIKRQCDDVERDDNIVLDEVNELESENQELQAELDRVSKQLYNQNE